MTRRAWYERPPSTTKETRYKCRHRPCEGRIIEIEGIYSCEHCGEFWYPPRRRQPKEPSVMEYATAEPKRILDLAAPLPAVDVGEIERRMQTCYGLKDSTDSAALLEALRQASEDVGDLLAVVRGHYRAIEGEKP